MDKELEKKLIKTVESVLEPINAKFISFGNSFVMYAGDVNNMKSLLLEENMITLYRMKLSTKHGELFMSFNSKDLEKDFKQALFISVGYSLRPDISNEECSEINSKILDLYKKK